MPSTPSPIVVLVPVKLDAFVFNHAVCDGGIHDAKIAPITQPNYTFLRVDKFVAQNDVLPHVDLHLSSPMTTNPRLVDLGTGKLRHRTGVYLHWSLPRAYRQGITPKEPAPEVPKPAIGKAPKFPPVPTRWLVIRHLHKTGKDPLEASFPEFQAWVVESDKPNDIDNLDATVDLEVDMSPFIKTGKPEEVKIGEQAEVFIGGKTAAEGWKEEDAAGDREELAVLTSSNPLFADYQPHNSNVFSMLDHFEYGPKKDQLPKATASYYVLGWHSSLKTDILHRLPLSKLADRLKDHLMTLAESEDEKTSREEEASKDKETPARVLCHGAMYDVEWNSTEKPVNTAADIPSGKLNSPMPVAVGTTVLDALLAFIQAHGPDSKEEEKDTVNEYSATRLMADIQRIHELLLARDDGVDGQREAADLLNHHNYDRVQCGTLFHISRPDTTGDEKTPQRPSEEKIGQLAGLNQVQYALDLTARTVRKLRWDLFSLWWKYVSAQANSKQDSKEDSPARDRQLVVVALSKQLAALLSSIDILTQDVEGRRKAVGAETAAMPNAYQQRDPTLLVPGVKSGWPHDFMDPLKVRLKKHIVTNPKPDPPLLKTINRILPIDLQDAGSALADEFLLLSPPDNKQPTKPKEVPPLYHDLDPNPLNPAAGEKPLRDQWQNTQPWFPLFLEWEVEYTHTPKESWILEQRLSTRKLQYGLAGDRWPANVSDSRHFSGRSLILPQPIFSLKSRIQQLFDTTPHTLLNESLPEGDRNKLLANLDKLPFMSSLLAGFTDHLVTRVHGTHIMPNIQIAGEEPQAISDIVSKNAETAGFTAHNLGLIGRESDLTPYGAMVKPHETHSLFKPVTHGRFKFTKINIIDKFGQAIHALNPIHSSGGENPCLGNKLYPCVGEFYSYPPKSSPDTAEPMPSEHEYVYMPPQINQFARLNSCFVVEDDSPGGSGWRPTTEWDTEDGNNPIWGWVVVNAPDNGIQLFFPDGAFYCAVRLGGSEGTSVSAKWFWNDPPAKPNAASKQLDPSRQLKCLASKLKEPKYLKAFIEMIHEATRNGSSAPTAYSQFVSSLVGKPFALANMGWSLELAVDAYTNQSTLDGNPSEPGLLAKECESCTKPDSQDQPTPVKHSHHEFQIKFGDQDQVFDGLAGYFNSTGGTLNLDRFYTYQRKSPADTTPPATTPPADPALEVIGPKNYPKFHAHWVSPYYLTVPGKDITNWQPADITIWSPAEVTIIGPPAEKTTIGSQAEINICIIRSAENIIIKRSSTEITIESTADITMDPPAGLKVAAIIKKSANKITIRSPADITMIRSPADIDRERNAELQVFGAILDPFTAVHAYSSFLPTIALQLPPFTWQSAMSKMTAFFHLGPLLVPTDVMAFLSSDKAKKVPIPPDVTTPAPGDKSKTNKIPIPAMGLAEWRWRQPWMDADEKETMIDLEIETLDQRPRFEKAPYTAIEGYLELVAPLSALDIVKKE